MYGSAHPSYYANVFDALQGKAEALINGPEGLCSLEFLIGAYRSARDAHKVHIPLGY